MIDKINIEELIHISSGEGSYAYYHNFYYQGYYLLIEETLFEKEDYPIHIYFNKIVDNSIKEVRDKVINTNKTESLYLFEYLHKPEIRTKYSFEHPIIKFLNIDKMLKRKKIINTLLNDIS